MKRYFYPATRAHHAYCMAIDFGMRFERRFGQLWTPEGLLQISGAGGYKIVVAEESLHLLKPQPGDLLLDDCRPSWCAVGLAHDDRIIIQRGGKPYHWPEIKDQVERSTEL